MMLICIDSEDFALFNSHSFSTYLSRKGDFSKNYKPIQGNSDAIRLT